MKKILKFVSLILFFCFDCQALAIQTQINKVTDLYKNVSAGNSAWIGAGCGHSSLSMNSVVTGKYVKFEIYINSGNKEYNKQLFDFLFSKKHSCF